MALEMPVGMSARAALSTHGLTTRLSDFGTVIAASNPLAEVACLADWDAIPDVPRVGQRPVPIATAVAVQAAVAEVSILDLAAGCLAAVAETVVVDPSCPDFPLTAVVVATVVADSDSPIKVADAMVADLVLPIKVAGAMTLAVARVIGTVWTCLADYVPALVAEDAACFRESERVVADVARIRIPVVGATSPERRLRTNRTVIG